MHIFLVSDSKTGINFFPQLEQFLRRRIVDADIDTMFLPFPEDIPAAVSSVQGEADLVFVFVLYEELDYKIKALLDKLIEIEMEGKTRVIKVIEESGLGSLDSIGLEHEKDNLAEKWGQFILDYLFKPEKFKPEEKPSELF